MARPRFNIRRMLLCLSFFAISFACWRPEIASRVHLGPGYDLVVPRTGKTIAELIAEVRSDEEAFFFFACSHVGGAFFGAGMGLLVDRLVFSAIVGAFCGPFAVDGICWMLYALHRLLFP